MQAEDTVVQVVIRINGKVLPRDSEPQQPGASVVFSPGVPHRFFRHMTSLRALKDEMYWIANICYSNKINNLQRPQTAVANSFIYCMTHILLPKEMLMLLISLNH